MAVTDVRFDNLEQEVQAHMASHPDDDIFSVRSALAMKAMVNEAPESVVKRTASGGKAVDLPVLRAALSISSIRSS